MRSRYRAGNSPKPFRTRRSSGRLSFSCVERGFVFSRPVEWFVFKFVLFDFFEFKFSLFLVVAKSGMVCSDSNGATALLIVGRLKSWITPASPIIKTHSFEHAMAWTGSVGAFSVKSIAASVVFSSRIWPSAR